MDVIVDIAKGNPSAMSFLFEVMQDYPSDALDVFLNLLRLDITGSKAYMIWNDICDRDTEKSIDLIKKAFKDEKLQEELKNNLENTRAVPMNF